MRRRDALFLPGLAGSLTLAGLGGGRARAATESRLWFIFLEAGQPTPADPAAVAAMQRGHLDNFKRLFAQGVLLAAGPLLDPGRRQRGIVVVRAATRDELLAHFAPDAYVRDGYLRVNAVPTEVRRALNTEGIDPEGIEELRIVQLGRGATPADGATDAARQALLQGLLDQGVFGAWYTLAEGPVAHVLFAPGTDSAALEATLAPYPGLGSDGVSLAVWRQWLGKGVLRRPA